MTTTYTPARLADLAQPSIKSLSRWLNAIAKWHAVCATVCALRGQEDTPEYAAAMALYTKTRMPSKDSKHRAYSDGARLQYLLNIDQTRATDVAGLTRILADAKAGR